MKFFWWLVGVFVFIFLLFYVVIFTNFGNKIIKPIVQSEIIKRTMLPVKLTVFSLSTNHFEANLNIDRYNHISILGNYSLFSKKINFTYIVHLKKLQTLQKITKIKLYGSLNTHGTIKGTLGFIKINGISDILKSQTTYHIILKDFNPISIIADINHAKIQTLLMMIGKKEYLKANTNIKINFKNVTPYKLDGYANLNISNALLNYKLIKNDFNITLPKTSIIMNMKINLKGNNIVYKCILNSNLAHITSNGTITSQPLHVNSKYNIYLQNLSLLTPIVNMPLRGKFDLSGTLIGNMDNLRANGYSKTLKGNINTVLHGTILQAKLKNIQTLPILYMLNYPTIFNSVANANFTYNISRKSGILQGELINGHFTPNIVLRLVKQYTKTNLYKESFNGNINAKINKQLINSTVFLKSNNASISTKNMLLDSKTDKIKASIDIIVNKNPLTINLHGKIQKPNVSINIKKLLQKKASRAVKKEIGNLLKRFF